MPVVGIVFVVRAFKAGFAFRYYRIRNEANRG